MMAVIRADFDEDYGLPDFDTSIPARSRADEILAELREHHAKQARATNSKAETKPMESQGQTALIGADAKPKRGKVYAFAWVQPWLRDDHKVYVKHQGQWYICRKTCPKATAYFAELNTDVDVRNWHEDQLWRLVGRKR